MASSQEFEPSPALTPQQIESFTRATASLRDQASKHASFGVFNLKDQPEDHYQDFREVYFSPTTNPDLLIVDGFCRRIMGKSESGSDNFGILRQAFRAKPDVLSQAKEMRSRGQKILMITPHKELVDVAMAMAAFQCEIGDPELINRTRIFVGPILKELEIHGIDAIAALQLSSGVLVGIPDTDSTRKKIESNELALEVEKLANDTMLAEFTKQIINGEIELVATAPSGSTDEETKDSILLKAVSRGTNTIGRRFFDGVLPVALEVGKSNTACIVGDMVKLDKGLELHHVMRDILAPMYEKITGKYVNYEWPDQQAKRKLGSSALKSS